MSLCGGKSSLDYRHRPHVLGGEPKGSPPVTRDLSMGRRPITGCAMLMRFPVSTRGSEGLHLRARHRLSLHRAERRRRLAMMGRGLVRGSDFQQRRLLAGLGPERDVVRQANATELGGRGALLAVVFLPVLAERELDVMNAVGEAGRHEDLGNTQHRAIAKAAPAPAAVTQLGATDLAL